jgi:ferredoxin--NADP+ reductase
VAVVGAGPADQPDVDGLVPPELADPAAIEELLVERGVEYTTWDGWPKLDKIERQLPRGRAAPRASCR